VTWDGANDGETYYVYRKTVDADNNPDDASILYLGTGSQTNTLKLWYYLDSAVKHGQKYQYGIVTEGYKDSGEVVVKSEIAWQAGTETSPYAAANKPAPGSKFSVPAFPEVKIDLINSQTPGNPAPGSEDVADKMLVTISNLDPFYSYKLFRQVSNDGAELNYTADGADLVADIWTVGVVDTTGTGTPSGADNTKARISNYLENGATITKQYNSGWSDGTIAAGVTRRLVVEINVANTTDYTLEFTTSTASSVLSSRQKSWAIAKK
jgi:hypothetical protein